MTKLTLAADELSPSVRSALSSVLESVLAEASQSVDETTSTEALLDILCHDHSRRGAVATTGARRIFGFPSRAGDGELAVA